jgi:hypothetical protein
LADGFGGLPGLGSQLGDSHPPRLVLHEFMRVTQVAELGSQPLGGRLAYMLHITDTHHHNRYPRPTTKHTHTHKHNGSRRQRPPILENTPKLLTKFQLRIQNSMQQLLIQIEPTHTSIRSVWVHNAAYIVLEILGAASQSENN